MTTDENFEKLRNNMVDEQIIRRGIKDLNVLKTMKKVGRHLFVPDEEKYRAYDDCPLPIGEGQTISQPYMVALMTDCLNLRQSDIVLEVGTGSGYQTAVLAELCSKVHSYEANKKLAIQAKENLSTYNYQNLELYVGDGAEITSTDQMFNAVIVTAGSPGRLDHLFNIMAEGARMVIPIGPITGQVLTVFTKHADQIKSKEVCRCMFVPLTGTHGFSN